MAEIMNSIRVTNTLGLVLLLALWLLLFRCAHVLVMLLRRAPLIGWAIGPLGITFMTLHEPSALYIWLDVLIPAFVSGSVLYVGLFTSLSPVSLIHPPLLEIAVIVFGVVLTSLGDLLNALSDLRHPLWGEVRLLRSLQRLRATSARIHFTPFGHLYLSDHFGSNPGDLLQVLSPRTRIQL